MCGIAAIVGLDGKSAERSVIEAMTRAIRHRGPDDDGHRLWPSVALGFRRLSILDLSPAGHQPMSTADGNLTIIFNGEIYNYVELREILTARGHAFTSTGDTEVLLKAYAEWGAECLSRLNGMWAFVIYDRLNATVFGARDRFGMKPLYRYQTDNTVLFASEIKAIRASGLYRGSCNWATASRFLLSGLLDDTRDSFYAGIDQIPPATAFELSLNGSYREWRYWSLDEGASDPVADPVRAFADLFEDAVRVHLRSDVPVAVHLSGGLDSTSIVSTASRLRRSAGTDTPLDAFSYVAPEFDESRFIADTIAFSGADLTELKTTGRSLWDDAEMVLQAQD